MGGEGKRSQKQLEAPGNAVVPRLKKKTNLIKEKIKIPINKKERAKAFNFPLTGCFDTVWYSISSQDWKGITVA